MLAAQERTPPDDPPGFGALVGRGGQRILLWQQQRPQDVVAFRHVEAASLVPHVVAAPGRFWRIQAARLPATCRCTEAVEGIHDCVTENQSRPFHAEA